MSDRPGSTARDSTARERILASVRQALEGRRPVERPEPFGGWRPGGAAGAAPAAGAFAARFERAGGEVARVGTDADAARWLERFLEEPTPTPAPPGRDARASGAAGRRPTVAVGAGVPPAILRRDRSVAPDAAAVGVSMARGAVAETGSLILDARDGRRTQILPPVHVVLVRERDVHATLAGALEALRTDLPSAIGLHSGPSKSADIGQILVKGVHGPGRVVALLILESP